MLVLMQVINHMWHGLDYSALEIDSAFTEVLNGDFSAEELLDVIGMDLTRSQLDRFVKAMPKYESALKVLEMQSE